MNPIYMHHGNHELRFSSHPDPEGKVLALAITYTDDDLTGRFPEIVAGQVTDAFNRAGYPVDTSSIASWLAETCIQNI